LSETGDIAGEPASPMARAGVAPAYDGGRRDLTDPNDIRHILTTEQLDRLRSGYDAEVMNRTAMNALVGPFPPARAFAEFVIDHFYRPGRWAPAHREQCVITYFASRSAGNAANLGTHIYWGLMEGLSPELVGDTILLAAAYSGIENYSAGIGVMKHVLTMLRGVVDDPDPDAVKCTNVIKKLRG
jgi:alkylhydroperoxidase/carboxymuconolactone decarboxylase family protein YurZ